MSTTLSVLTESSRQQFLSFLFAGQTCAIDLQQVHEIVYVDSVTRIPNVHACIRGVVNLRGSVVPVIDVGLGLGLGECAGGAQLCLVVVEVRVGADTAAIGLIVDQVPEAFPLDRQDIESVPSFGTRIAAHYLAGVVRRDGAFISILDLDALLAEGALFRERERS